MTSTPHPLLPTALLLAALSPLNSPAADTLHLACDGCHGPGGISQAEHIPSIDGLNFRYLYATLQGFRKELRHDTVMGRIMKGYRGGELQRLALHYGTRPWQGRQADDIDAEQVARGRELHREYCEKCHEQHGRFQDHETPPLAGQARGYLFNQMLTYRIAATLMPQPPLMQERLEKLSDEDLLALAEFFAANPDAEGNTGQ